MEEREDVFPPRQRGKEQWHLHSVSLSYNKFPSVAQTLHIKLDLSQNKKSVRLHADGE